MNTDATFEVLLARRVLLNLRASEFQALAISLIETGYDCPELHELAWDLVSTRHEAEGLFDCAAKAIGLVLPTRQIAVQTLLHYYATRMASGAFLPHEELVQLMKEVYWSEVAKHQSRVYVGDSHDMHEFIGAHWSYDDMLDNPNDVSFNGLYGDEALRAFDDHVRDTASAWLTRHLVDHPVRIHPEPER